ATVDFMASSQAFREYLKKLPPDNTIPPALTDEHVPLYIRRLDTPVKQHELVRRLQHDVAREHGFDMRDRVSRQDRTEPERV
ncbi:hypothetical protein ACSLOD_28250, partial [Escherichia coli]